jgi:hypothetical protein
MCAVFYFNCLIEKHGTAKHKEHDIVLSQIFQILIIQGLRNGIFPFAPPKKLVCPSIAPRQKKKWCLAPPLHQRIEI